MLAEKYGFKQTPLKSLKLIEIDGTYPQPGGGYGGRPGSYQDTIKLRSKETKERIQEYNHLVRMRRKKIHMK